MCLFHCVPRPSSFDHNIVSIVGLPHEAVYTNKCCCNTGGCARVCFVCVSVCLCVCYRVLQRGKTRCQSVKEKVWNKAVLECSSVRHIVRELATINTIQNRLRNDRWRLHETRAHARPQ